MYDNYKLMNGDAETTLFGRFYDVKAVE